LAWPLQSSSQSLLAELKTDIKGLETMLLKGGGDYAAE
jgi:hypothetical protein